MLFPAYKSSDCEGSSTQNAVPGQRSQASDWLCNNSFESAAAAALQMPCPKPAVSSAPDWSERELVADICPPGKRTHDSEEEGPSTKYAKTKHFLSEVKESESGSDTSVPHQSHKKKKKHRHKKSKTHKKHKEKEKEEHRTTKLPKMLKNKVFIEDVGMDPEVAFGMDRDGDVNNLAYESIYKMHVARYRRIVSLALGCGSTVWVVLTHKEYNKEQGPGRPDLGRYYHKGNRSQQENVMDLSGMSLPVKTASAGLTGRLMSETVRPRTAGPLPSYIKLTVDTPSFGEHHATRTDSKSDSHHEEMEQQSLKQKASELNSHLHAHPEDVSGWLQLVALQPTVISLDGDGQTTMRTAVVRDIQLAVLERALEKNPASIQLRLQQLQLAAATWDATQLGKAWKQLTFHHPNDPQVWRSYLRYRGSQFSSLTISALIKVYAQCLGKLLEVNQGKLASHKAPAHLQEDMLEIFQWLCQWLWQSGHTEKASALYQAMLEFNLNCPAVLAEADLAMRLEFLETFWDSGTARFGETSAPGWARWLELRGDVQCQNVPLKEEDERLEEEILDRAQSQSETFVELESLRSSRHWLPWRPDIQAGESEEDCEDPERLVLFDDIKPCLFPVTQDHCVQLVCGWLELLEAPVPDLMPSCCSMWHRRQQTFSESHNIALKSDALRKKFSPTLDSTLKRQVAVSILEQAIQKCSGAQRTMLTLCLLELKISELNDMDRSERRVWKTKCKEVKKSVKNVLKEEGNRNNLLLWERYAVLEWELGGVEEGRKVLDMALSMAGQNVQTQTDWQTRCMLARLYRTYVELELGLRPNLIVRASCDSHPGQVSGERAADRARAMHLLCTLGAAAQMQPFQAASVLQRQSAVNVLKARAGLQQYHQQALMDMHWLTSEASGTELWATQLTGSVALHWTVCYAFFQYLTLDLSSATTVFRQALGHASFSAVQKQLSTKSHNPENVPESMPCVQENHSCVGIMLYGLYEQTTVAQLRLIQRHIQTCVSPLSVLRVPLYAALDVFPDNVTLLSMAVDLESGGNMAGQRRRRLKAVGQISHTPHVWLMAVDAELQHIARLRAHQAAFSQIMQGNIGQSPEITDDSPPVGTRHQLRAWLEYALSQAEMRHSPLLWRVYMHCEMQQPRKDRVKGIFYEALQHCPTSKDIYLDCIRYFPAMIQEVTDIMTEKELRVRTPLEEVDLLLSSKSKSQLSCQEEELHVQTPLEDVDLLLASQSKALLGSQEKALYARTPLEDTELLLVNQSKGTLDSQDEGNQEGNRHKEIPLNVEEPTNT